MAARPYGGPVTGERFLTVAPNDFTHLHVHSEFSLLDGLGRITRAGRRRPRARLRLAGHHRPRRAVRRGRLLPGMQHGGHQADHRRRDVRRAALDGRPRGQGRRQALPPDPAGARTGPATRTCVASSPTRTSTATTTSRASIATSWRKHSEGLVGLSACLNGEVARSLETGDMGRGAPHRRLLPRHPGRRQLLLRAPGPRPARAAPAQRAAAAPGARDGHPARRHQRPALRPRASSPRRTTCCCASARRRTSTRRAGCASSRATST